MLDLMLKAAYEAGRFLIESKKKLAYIRIEEKGKNDFVSDIDRGAERIIREILGEKPEIPILGEELGGEIKGEEKFIIDPLDGTTNYIHKIPYYGVSIGYERNGEIVAGVIYNPERDVVYYAEENRGAFKKESGEEKRMSAEGKSIEESVISMGFPFRANKKIDKFLRLFGDFIFDTHGVRRMGAASLNIANVADGVFDADIEFRLAQWDIAAGIVIAREAGCIFTDHKGENNYMETGNILVANERIYKTILRMVKDV
ncbi:MAG: inositol monophosphatase [Proteobacteria bacterium]|nr:inositol monophosphatase [Pseudomonadota bacterium]